MLSLRETDVVAPTLVIAVGNPSRGDDALGPLAAERIEACGFADVEVLVDFQLQVEHALDLAGRHRVLFIDADASLAAPFALAPIEPARDRSYSSHAMSPAAVLHAFQQLIGEPPPAWLLAIRGASFELGEGLSATAFRALDAALQASRTWLSTGNAPPALPASLEPRSAGAIRRSNAAACMAGAPRAAC